jgi:hypothetical protein
MTRSQLVGNLRSNTLNHFPSITALTANSLPFVIDEWTFAGTVSPDSTPTDVRLVGTPEQQSGSHPLELTVADFS